MATIRHTIALVASAKEAIDGVRKYSDTIYACANSVNTLERQLSGEKLFVNANKWAATIAKMGGAVDGLATQENVLAGVAKLSGENQEKANRIFREAAEQHERMGPAHAKAAETMRQYEAATRKTVAPVQDAAKAQTNWNAALGKANGLLGAFGLGLSVTAVVGFAKSILNTADELVKLSDKTGMSITGVQRLQYVAQQSGNTLEQVTSAVSMMQKRLAGGEDSAVAALKKLDISFGQFVGLAPDQQFLAIARAIGEVEDPMERTKLATDLLGRSGADVLPSLIADVDRLASAAPVMSERAVRAFDDIGDSLSRLWTRAKNASGEVVATAIDAYSRLGGTLGNLVKGNIDKATDSLLDLETQMPRVKAPTLEVGQALTGTSLSATELSDVEKELSKSFSENQAAAKKHAEEQKRAAEATEKFRNSIKAIDSDGVLWRYLDTLPDLSGRTQGFRNELAGLTKNGLLPTADSLADIATKLPDVRGKMADARDGAVDLAGGMDEAAKAVRNARQGAAGFAATLAAGLREDLKQIPSIIVDSLTGGGGLAGAAQAIGSMIGKRIGQSIGEALGGDLGAEIGGALGSLLGPALSKLFKTEGKKVNDMRDAFVDLAGGIEELNQHAQDAGTTLNELLRADTVEEYERAVRNLEERFQRLDDAIQRYGMTWTDLRPERRTIALGEAVRDLAVDMRTLETAGYAHDAILRKQATAYNDLVVAAVNAGEDIPPAMGPILLELANMGLLSEQAQRALLGLKDEGVVDWQAMEDAAGRYGIKLEDLGPKFQAAKLHDGAQQLIDDWELLVGGGADLGAVMAGMDEQVTAMVANAIKYGIELPAGMKPIVEAMYNAGEFADDNGEKFEDLSQVKFAEPIEAQFGKVIEAIEALILKLGQIYDPTITPHWDDSEIPDWYDPGGDTGGAGEDEQMHRGGLVMHRGGFVAAGHAGASYWAGGEAIARAHSGLAVDEVPIIAQTGEGILSRKGMGRLGRAALRELNEGGGFGGGGTGEADPRVLRAMAEQAAEIAMLRQELATVLPKAIRDSALLAKVS